METQIITDKGMLPEGVHFSFAIDLSPDCVQQAAIDEVLSAYRAVLTALIAEIVACNAAVIAVYREIDYLTHYHTSIDGDGLRVELDLAIERFAVPKGFLEAIAQGVLGSFIYLHMTSNTRRALEAKHGCMRLADHFNTMRRAENRS